MRTIIIILAILAIIATACCLDAATLNPHALRAREVVAACLIGEAGGDGYRGMEMVMNVIQNRSIADRKTFRQVVNHPKAFCAMKNGEDATIAKAKRHARWHEAMQIVERAEQGRLKDYTNGAYFFQLHHVKIKKWHGAKTVTYKGHVFFRKAVR